MKIMLGLGENVDEVKQVLQDLRTHACDMLTLGQYLQPIQKCRQRPHGAIVLSRRRAGPGLNQ